MNTFEPLTRAQLSRRVVLKGMGALGAGAALAPFSGVRPAVAQTETIQDILNVTVTVEKFGVTFLGLGLESAANGNFDPPIPDPVIAIVVAARAQEQAHLDFFESLGGQSLTDTFTVPDPALLTDPVAFFGAVSEQEARETAAQIAAFSTFTALSRPDLVKVSFQYGAEEAEHRVLANYAAGVRPPNNFAFSPALFTSTGEIITAMQEVGLISGSGPAATYPGPDDNFDFSNVTNTEPDGPEVSCGPITMPNTGTGIVPSGNDERNLAGLVGLTSFGAAAAALVLRMRAQTNDQTEPQREHA